MKFGKVKIADFPEITHKDHFFRLTISLTALCKAWGNIILDGLLMPFNNGTFFM